MTKSPIFEDQTLSSRESEVLKLNFTAIPG